MVCPLTVSTWIGTPTKNLSNKLFSDAFSLGTGLPTATTKELFKLAGNGMSMRCLYVAMIIGLSALNSAKVQRYLRE